VLSKRLFPLNFPSPWIRTNSIEISFEKPIFKEEKSMKRKGYIVFVLLMAVAMLVSGCATTPSATPAAAQTQAPAATEAVAPVQTVAAATTAPVAAKPTKMVMGIITEPETYFPGYETSALASYGFELVFNELTTYDLQGKIIGDLAKSWEISSDQLTWTFHLVPGVKWQDGQPFSAKDVQFTLEMLADSKYTGTYYSMIASIVGAKDKHDGKATSVSGINVVDDNTITITTDQPNALFLQTMASVMPILPQHVLKDIAVADLANSAFARAPIGTGPFILKEWKAGESLSYVKNPDYFQGAPKIDQFIWQIIPEPTAQITALVNGEIDYLDGISADNFPQLKTESKLATGSFPGSRVTTLNFHSTDPLLADVRVRQAIAHSLDREAMLTALGGGMGKVENSLFHPSLPEHDANLQGYSYDVAAAKELLKEAGWTDQNGDGFLEAKGVKNIKDGTKFSIELGFPTQPLYVQLNELIQQDLKAIGIDSKLNSQDSNLFWSKYYIPGGPWQLAGLGWSNLIGSPQQELLWNLTCDSQSYFDYCNKELDALVAKNNSIFDDQARVQNFAAIQELIQKEAVYLPLLRLDGLFAYNKNLVLTPFQSTIDFYRSMPQFYFNN
jgi:peptide/nickel transport system substrate-binding protein